MKRAAEIEPEFVPGATIASRLVAAGVDWSIAEVSCRAGPRDAPYEERHTRMSISAVVAGTFSYRCEVGRALLYPGALMLGNPGTCFECGHEHSSGDKCVAFHLAPALFQEIAASAAGTSRFRFPAPMLPAMPELLPALVEIDALTQHARRMAGEHLAIRLAERVSETMRGVKMGSVVPARGDERRISAVLRYIEENAERDLDLNALAGLACMSKYHFLRVFRRATGMTPYKFVTNLRMRRAAVALATTRAPVAEIAFGAGFGDLSTFNHRFRETFGAAPSHFRRSYAA
jgi:AraC-like DNA-binding protein